MAKAIVRINAFLDRRQTKEVYNSIYDQLKAGLDVIIVPAYCDVYVLDGGDVKMQKDTEDTTPEKKDCSTCKYDPNQLNEEPCVSCILGENHSRWEAKDNG